MKACLVRVLGAGLLLLPSIAFAQEDFSGRWEAPGSTQLADLGIGPFGAAPVITQTADGISWPNAEGDEQTLRLDGPSVVNEHTYTARWVHRALVIESRWPRVSGVLTIVQILIRNASDELELVSVLPLSPQDGGGSRFSRVVYQRRE